MRRKTIWWRSNIHKTLVPITRSCAAFVNIIIIVVIVYMTRKAAFVSNDSCCTWSFSEAMLPVWILANTCGLMATLSAAGWVAVCKNTNIETTRKPKRIVSVCNGKTRKRRVYMEEKSGSKWRWCCRSATLCNLCFVTTVEFLYLFYENRAMTMRRTKKPQRQIDFVIMLLHLYITKISVVLMLLLVALEAREQL